MPWVGNYTEDLKTEQAGLTLTEPMLSQQYNLQTAEVLKPHTDIRTVLMEVLYFAADREIDPSHQYPHVYFILQELRQCTTRDQTPQHLKTKL
jgi:hypothetical protein